jgi:N-acetylmuramic acid 6-phosphate etherase
MIPGETPARPDAQLLTEASNPESRGLDRLSSQGIVELMHAQDLEAWKALANARVPLGQVVDRAVESYRSGGRVVYVGAGTSGRLGVLDASECPPTFGVDPDHFIGIIAGGDRALRESIEGAEDSPEEGALAMRQLHLDQRDLVCGIAASGSTPYVLGALEEALERGAGTALLACNRLDETHDAWRIIGRLDCRIELLVGPEIIAGSTRMKAGTATKMALNMISTATMVRVGKVHDNLMVDVRPVNRKLVLRATRLIMKLGRVSEDEARDLLERADNDVKTAIVMSRRGASFEEACVLLERAGGILRQAIEEN